MEKETRMIIVNDPYIEVIKSNHMTICSNETNQNGKKHQPANNIKLSTQR